MATYVPPTKRGLANNGFTSRYEFQYDRQLAGIEPARLNAVIAECDTDLALMEDWFGFRPPGDDTVTVTAWAVTSPTGAVTTFPAFSNQVDIKIDDEGDAVLVRYLLISEMSEVYIRSAVFQAAGRWFGDSNEGSQGEALSRFLAARFLAVRDLGLPPSGYATSWNWLQSARDDYVNVTFADDNNPDPITGCGLLFLYYLYSQLGYSIQQIIAAAGSTLAQCYRNLTGATDDPFPAFKALIDYYFPGTSTIGRGDPDNPFPLAWPRQLFDGQGVVHIAPGLDGALYGFRRPSSGYWFGLDMITPAGQVTAGSTVAVGAQGEQQLDAVYVGADGALHAVWSINAVAQWQGPYPISPPGVADPGATVSLARQGPNQLDAIYVGLDGALHVVWATDAVPAWQGPVRISGRGAVDPGGTVALCAQGPNLYAVFVGLDGALYVISATEGIRGWQGPVRISTPGLIDPGTSISLVADGDHQIDGVYVGLDGAIHTVWKSAGAPGWQGPAPATAPEVADPSASISIAAHGPHAIDVVYAGLDSTLYALWRDAGDPGWHGPVPITGSGVVDPGVSVRLVAQRSGRVDAVFIGLDGALHAVGADRAYVGQFGNWGGITTLTRRGLFAGTAPAAARFALARRPTGSVEVFGRGRDSAYYHRSVEGTSPSGAWVSLGGVFTSPPAAVTAGNTVHLFGRGRDSAYYHRSVDGTTVSGAWVSLGGVFTSPPAAVTAGDTVHLLGRGADSAYYHCELDAGTGQVIKGLQLLGGLFTSAPVVIAYQAGVNVVGRGSDGGYDHRHNDGIQWLPAGSWEPLGGVFTSPPALASSPPSRFLSAIASLNVVGRGRDSGYYRRTFIGDGWIPIAGWEPLGGVFTSPPLTLSAGSSELAVLGRGRDSSLYHRDFDGRAWNPPSGWDDLGGVFSDQ